MTSATAVFRKLRWPPSGLGLESTANLALLSPAWRRRFVRTTILAVLVGLLTVLTMAVLDRVLFAGESVQRIRELGRFSFSQRIVIVVFSAVTEEIVYRLVVATAIASITRLALRRVMPHPKNAAMWAGIAGAALLFGLAHVANAAHVAHPYLRAITLNGIAGVVLGWLYWFRGLEAAVLAHLVADSLIYLLIAGLI